MPSISGVMGPLLITGMIRGPSCTPPTVNSSLRQRSNEGHKTPIRSHLFENKRGAKWQQNAPTSDMKHEILLDEMEIMAFHGMSGFFEINLYRIIESFANLTWRIIPVCKWLIWLVSPLRIGLFPFQMA